VDVGFGRSEPLSLAKGLCDPLVWFEIANGEAFFFERRDRFEHGFMLDRSCVDDAVGVTARRRGIEGLLDLTLISETKVDGLGYDVYRLRTGAIRGSENDSIRRTDAVLCIEGGSRCVVRI
jgi:hypothetical protein